MEEEIRAKHEATAKKAAEEEASKQEKDNDNALPQQEVPVSGKDAAYVHPDVKLGGSLLCCKCGIPNAANMCVKCVGLEVDNIREGLQAISQCPECERYLEPPRTWINARLGSEKLLTLCVKRLKSNLNKQVRLVDAEFFRTEKRIKVKLNVQINGAVVEQAFIVEFVLDELMCESCIANPDDEWIAKVKLRQYDRRRSFLYVEQQILKQNAAVDAIKIKQMDQGIDFLFTNRSHGFKIVRFIDKIAPVRQRTYKKLVCRDEKSNTFNYKFTFSVEMSPICRDDLICLPPKLANSKNLGPLVICTDVTNNIALLDPLTLRSCFLDGQQYYQWEFKPLLTSRQLVEYIVVSVEEEEEISSTSSNQSVSTTTSYTLTDVQIARVSDWGKNKDFNIFTVRTHLGHILKEGDYALGYDLYRGDLNSDEVDNYTGFILPEAILVKKKNSYEMELEEARHGG